jgi:hypothetical protein
MHEFYHLSLHSASFLNKKLNFPKIPKRETLVISTFSLHIRGRNPLGFVWLNRREEREGKGKEYILIKYMFGLVPKKKMFGSKVGRKEERFCIIPL